MLPDLVGDYLMGKTFAVGHILLGQMQLSDERKNLFATILGYSRRLGADTTLVAGFVREWEIQKIPGEYCPGAGDSPATRSIDFDSRRGMRWHRRRVAEISHNLRFPTIFLTVTSRLRTRCEAIQRLAAKEEENAVTIA